MKKHVVTVTPPTGSNGTGWVDVDVTGTPLDPIAEGDPIVINPVDKNVSITSFGLALAFASGPNTVSFGVKLLSAPVDVLVSTH